ncbi:MAG: phospholipid carrier-dependent glycosyltransferase, partial [Roseiflexaceae bacterium]|nr:phospholipid carrier-dependent glycosyltransferase [Roseiflexus sp.]MDW8231480.1 phospholipid carrier-dependent glycosyltransferase [Roseiflexaceae bacterium]
MKRSLVILFLVALIPRFWAIDWGLPYVEHPDEPALVETAVRMVQENDWNPRRFMYPSLYFYLLASVAFLHAQWGIATGIYSSLADLPLKTYLFTL